VVEAGTSPVSTIEIVQVPFKPFPAATAIPPTPAPQCRVVASTVALLPGPGGAYGLALGNLGIGAALEPIGRNTTADWIQVHVVGSRQTGWVPVGTTGATCDMQIATLPLSAVLPIQRP
jgi:hypothetical protein